MLGLFLSEVTGTQDMLTHTSMLNKDHNKSMSVKITLPVGTVGTYPVGTYKSLCNVLTYSF